jgi:hypothetical protein
MYGKSGVENHNPLTAIDLAQTPFALLVLEKRQPMMEAWRAGSASPQRPPRSSPFTAA